MSPSSDKIICHCLGVTETDIRSAISTGEVRSTKCVMNGTGAGTGCSACVRRIAALLCEECPQSAGPSPVCVVR